MDEAVSEVKNLMFLEQLVEEKILLEIFTKNAGKVSQVDELRLDFDRIYSRKQLTKKCLFGNYKLIDSAKYTGDFSIQTILRIKNEERYLNAKFQDFHVLVPKRRLLKSRGESLLFARLKNNNFYLVNDLAHTSTNLDSIFNRISRWVNTRIFSKTSLK